MKKTLVALFVALCMVLTMAPAMAFAADELQIDSVVYYADGKDADEALGVTGSADQTFVVNLKTPATFGKLGFEVAHGSNRYYYIATKGGTDDFDKTQYVFSFKEANNCYPYYQAFDDYLEKAPTFNENDIYKITMFTFDTAGDAGIKGYEPVGDVYQGTIPAAPVEEPELINGFLEEQGDQAKDDNGKPFITASSDQTVYASLNLEKKLSVLFEITIGDKTYSATATDAKVSGMKAYYASFMEVDFINEEAATDNDTLILVPGTYTVTVSTYGEKYSGDAPANYPIDAKERYSFDITVASADYSRWDALNALIDSFDEMDYTKDAWDAFQEDYAAYFDDENENYYLKPGQAKYYQDDIKKAVEAVIGLVNTLRENLTANYDYLNAMIAVAEGLDKSDYTADSWEAVETALKEAKEVPLRLEATPENQTDVDKAAVKLVLAMSKLVGVEKANYAAVDAAIAKAETLTEADYTADSWAAVEAAINAVVRDLPVSDQTKVDAMAKAINDAIDALVVEKANYAAVDAAIAKAETLTEADYTADSWAAVEAAINAVVRDLPVSDQAKVDAMAKAINDAIDALVAAEPEDPTDPEDPTEIVFDDVEQGRWSAQYIYDLVEKGICDGIGDNKFNPEGNIERCAFAKILAEASGDDLTRYEGTSNFADCRGSWAETYINWAYENGIVTGRTDTTFDPYGEISRQEMAAMIYRYAEYKGIELPETNELITFDDEEQIADYAAEAVDAMQKAGIINGMDNNEFQPQGTATREQAAKMISVLLSL